jgi:hypothetical protein
VREISGAESEGDAGDGGVVVDETDRVPVGEEFGEGVALAVADFEREETAGAEEVEGLRDEAAVDIEAGGAGVEGEGWLVVADLGGEGGSVVEGDVGRVRGDDVEGGISCDGREEVAFEEANARREVEAHGVVAGDGESGGRDVDGGEGGVLEDGGDGDGDCAGAGAYVGDAEMWVRLLTRPVEDGFDEVFSFGARDEDVARHAEGEAEELLRAGEVLQRMLRGAAGGEVAEGIEVRRGEIVVGVSEEPGAVAVEDVGEQGLGVAAGDGGRGFKERVAEGHLWMRIAARGVEDSAETTSRESSARDLQVSM